MLERHKLLMGRTQDRVGQNNGSIGVFWRSFNGIIGHIRCMFRGPKITHNHGHSSLYTASAKGLQVPVLTSARIFAGLTSRWMSCRDAR